MIEKNGAKLSEVNSLKLTVRTRKTAPSMLKKFTGPVLVAAPKLLSSPPMLLSTPKPYAFYVRTTDDTRRTLETRRAFDLLPSENEDSILTGMTRSLHRRVMGLNIPQIAMGAVPHSAQAVSMPIAAVRTQAQQQPRIAS
jgi:hypothetical protein